MNAADLIEFAADDDGGYILHGRLAVYNTPVQIGHRHWEQIAPGAFTHTIEHDFDQIRLTDLHVKGAHKTHQPMGKPISFDDQPDALYGTFQLANTTRARDTKALYDTGVVTGLSVGYDIQHTRTRAYRNGQLSTTTQATLDHIAFVAKPAYKDAQVLAIRNQPDQPTTLHPHIWRLRYPQTQPRP